MFDTGTYYIPAIIHACIVTSMSPVCTQSANIPKYGFFFTRFPAQIRVNCALTWKSKKILEKTPDIILFQEKQSTLWWQRPACVQLKCSRYSAAPVILFAGSMQCSAGSVARAILDISSPGLKAKRELRRVSITFRCFHIRFFPCNDSGDHMHEGSNRSWLASTFDTLCAFEVSQTLLPNTLCKINALHCHPKFHYQWAC